MKITRKESTHFADAPIRQQQTAGLQCEKKNSKETKGSMCAFFNERQKNGFMHQITWKIVECTIKKPMHKCYAYQNFFYSVLHSKIKAT